MASEGSDVDIASVAEYGLSTVKQMTTFMSGIGGPFGAASSAMLGLAGTPEGAEFSAMYGAKLQEVGLLLEDVSKGLQALGYGAIVIADNYHQSDMSQKQALDSVNAAFHPPAGAESVAADAQKTQDELARAADAAARNRDLHPLPAAQQDTPSVCVVSPQSEADTFQDRHDNATWRPEPPPKVLAPGPYAPGDPRYTGPTTA